MGVLDEAIREHLDLKRRRGAADDEIARAEAEALGPARRAVPPAFDDEDEADPRDPAEYEQPPRIDPGVRREPTHAVHDIDEDPLAPPPPVGRVDRAEDDADRPPPLAHDPDDEPVGRPPPITGRDVDDEPAEQPPVDHEPPADEPPIDHPPHEDPGGQRRF
jgi:hypothetical protein